MARDGDRVERRRAFGHDLGPVFPLGVLRRERIEAEPRRAFVRPHVDPRIGRNGLEDRIRPFRERHKLQRPRRRGVGEIDVAARPTAERADDEPPTIRAELEPEHIFRRTVVAENFGVVLVRLAERMRVDPRVVVAAGRKAHVVEAGLVGKPGDAAEARIGNGIFEPDAARHVEDAEGTALVAVLREPEGDVAARGTRIPVIDRRQSRLVHELRVEDRPFLVAIAHVQDRLARSSAPRAEEHKVAPADRGAERVDREQLVEAPFQLGAARKVAKGGARPTVLLGRPRNRPRVPCVFQKRERIRAIRRNRAPHQPVLLARRLPSPVVSRMIRAHRS